MVRFGEISLKSEISRRRMEKKLIRNINEAVKANGIDVSITTTRGRIWLCCFNDEEKALTVSKILSHVMGVVSSSPVTEVSFNSINDLIEKASKFFSDRIKNKTFAVRVKRIGEHGFTSKDIEKMLGAVLLQTCRTKVDLKTPEYTAFIEIRNDKAYFYDKIVKGPGGLPIGVEGKVLSLFSGGIDSPVATWYVLKRGCEADMLLFNIGGEKHVWSVAMVAKALVDKWVYGYKPKMYVVDARPFIARIAINVPENYIVIILRRTMNKIAERLASRIKALALVTGESLGQVASQTLNNIYAVEEVVRIPVLRPLIGMDKEEIVVTAKKIGTYEYSIKIEEYCTLGTRTTTPRADLNKIRKYDEKIGIFEYDIDKILDEANVIDLKSIDYEYILNKLNSLNLGKIYRCRT